MARCFKTKPTTEQLKEILTKYAIAPMINATKPLEEAGLDIFEAVSLESVVQARVGVLFLTNLESVLSEMNFDRYLGGDDED